MPGTSQWTPALRSRFVDYLSASGNVCAAAAACGLSRQSVYKLRRRNPLFARDWGAAVEALRAAADREFEHILEEDPRFARLRQVMQLQRGGEFALQDPVNSINRVSTIGDQRTHSSPISSNRSRLSAQPSSTFT
jgi:hypothetical protein